MGRARGRTSPSSSQPSTPPSLDPCSLAPRAPDAEERARFKKTQRQRSVCVVLQEARGEEES
eukprot:3193018-Rhodomonas_salina.1